MYLDHFDFIKPPFTGSDTETFFNGRSYEATYEGLRRGILEHHGILLLTGDSGVGKSTLLRRLLVELKEQMHCIFFWNAHLTFEDLLDYLCEDLELSLPNTHVMQKLQVLAYLIAKRAENQDFLLLIDDAQQLPAETLQGLQQLTRLETAGRGFLQVVLSGHPALEQRLRQEPLERPLMKDLGGHYRLDGLKDSEIIPYIQKRLRAAGYPREALFEHEALHRVIAYARGIPRLVNLICNQALVLAYLQSDYHIRAAMVREITLHSQLQELTASATASFRLPSAGPSVHPRFVRTADSSPRGPAHPAAEPASTSAAQATQSRALVPLESMTAASAVPPGPMPHIIAEISGFPRRSRRSRQPWLITSLFIILFGMAGTVLAMRYVDTEQLLSQLARSFELVSQKNPLTE